MLRPYNVRETCERLAARRMRPRCGGPQIKMSTPVMQGTGNKAFDIAWVREQFPSLKLQVNGQVAGFFGGPGGAQVPKHVIDAVKNYFLTKNANTYGAFPTSRRTNETILSA